MIRYISQLVSIIIIIINNSTQYKAENRHRKFHSIIKLSVIVTEDWRANGYGWYQNGRKSLPSSAAVVEKIYNFLLVEGDSAPVKSKKFSKIVYHLHNDPRGTQGTVVQHLGKNVTHAYKVHTQMHSSHPAVPR